MAGAVLTGPVALMDQLVELSALTLALLIGAAFLAGWVDAVVGGGGLIQLPALLPALPAHTCPGAMLRTNNVSSAAATAGALVVGALCGSAAGAGLATFIPKPWLSPVVLAALLVVGAYTLLRPSMGLEHAPRHSGRAHLLRSGGIGGVIGG